MVPPPDHQGLHDQCGELPNCRKDSCQRENDDGLRGDNVCFCAAVQDVDPSPQCSAGWAQDRCYYNRDCLHEGPPDDIHNPCVGGFCYGFPECAPCRYTSQCAKTDDAGHFTSCKTLDLKDCTGDEACYCTAPPMNEPYPGYCAHWHKDRASI